MVLGTTTNYYPYLLHLYFFNSEIKKERRATVPSPGPTDLLPHQSQGLTASLDQPRMSCGLGKPV